SSTGISFGSVFLSTGLTMTSAILFKGASFHSPLNLTPYLSSKRFLPVSSCCIRAFFCCWLLASSCPVVVMALSQVERIWAIFFCSGSGGTRTGNSLIWVELILAKLVLLFAQLRK